MEIRGVSSTTAVRPTAFQPMEAGVAASSAGSVQPSPTQTGSTAAGGEAGKSSGPGYISPYLRYDQGARVAVLYFRDFDTGETQDQIPSQRVVEEYRRAADRLAQDDQRKSTGTQTASGGKADPAAGSTDGLSNGTTSRAGAATAWSTAGTGLGGGTSFAGGSVDSGSAAATGAASPGTPSTGAVPATSGFTPAAAAGRYGGSPGGLVSVTV
ncbi:hypothetical protein [Azospirillum sp. INR13]|uniref:hypothetical protein n=1 Tax=Azospirillum sp. INR13 TaxID=2596919 RepID=UPI001892132A|nr:hypothetical protein [Azospirillum sp. INR13]